MGIEEKDKQQPEVTKAEQFEALKKALCRPERVFPTEAVKFAMAEREIALDVAHSIIEEAKSKAINEEEDQLNFGPIFAVYLMGYHRDEKAFDLLSEISRLLGYDSDAIFGDVITEDMCAILWSIAGGEADRLFSLVDDPTVESYWKSAALRAIAIGVAEGTLDREEMLEALGRRLAAIVEDPAAADPTGVTATWLARTITDLGVGDNGDLLNRAYDQELIEPFVISPSHWEKAALKSPEEIMGYLQERDGWRFPVDPLGLKKWVWFQSGVHGRKSAAIKQQRRGRDRAKAKAKAKRKASQKSRRKNRKKKR